MGTISGLPRNACRFTQLSPQGDDALTIPEPSGARDVTWAGGSQAPGIVAKASLCASRRMGARQFRYHQGLVACMGGEEGRSGA